MRKIWKRCVSLMVIISLSVGLLYEDFGARDAAVAFAGVVNVTQEMRPDQDYDQLNAMLKDLSVASAEPIREIGEGNLNNVSGVNQDVIENAEGNLFQQFMSLTQNYGEAMSKVIAGSEEAEALAHGSKIAGWIGTFLDMKNLADDVEALSNLKNENLFYRTLEESALRLDAMLAVISIANAFLNFIPGGFAVTIGLALLSFLIGLLAAYLHSDEFADEKNSELDFKWWLLSNLILRTKTPNGVNCLKPNIYIYYADTETPIQVQFTYPRLLTTTIPDYNSGWNVTNRGNGQLAGEDGSIYEYLFYESVTSKSLFQKEAGYRIPASEREDAFRNILTAMGFTSGEIDDFVEFWSQRLTAGTDYIMYPQDTDTVNRAMPVTVTPEPDHMERIWFVFEQDAGQNIKAPETILLERDDRKTVIEWGGMVFDE